jgi:hypothetical protein
MRQQNADRPDCFNRSVKTGAAGLQRSMTIVMRLSDKIAALLKKFKNFNGFSVKKIILSGKFINRYCEHWIYRRRA